MTKTVESEDFSPLEDVTFPILDGKGITFQGDPKAYTLDLARKWVNGDDRYESSLNLLKKVVRPDEAGRLETWLEHTGGRGPIGVAAAMTRYWRTGLLPQDPDPKDETSETISSDTPPTPN